MKFYTIPKIRVVYEVLSSEVILIDFNTGNYYTLTHVAKQVWQGIEQTMSLEAIAQLLSDRYKKELSVVLSDLEKFFEQLVAAGLIEGSTEIEPLFSDVMGIEFDQLGYEAPRLQEYSDVQNLLLLDPIHEVTEAGWPDKLG